MAISLAKSLRLRSLRLSTTAQCLTKPTLPHRLYALTISEASTPSPPASHMTTTAAIAPATTPAASSSSQAQKKQRGALSKLLLFLPGAITFGLGTWQLVRRQEKIEMLDYRMKRLEMDPVTCGSLPSSDRELGSSEFRRVICEGDFDESRSVYVGPRSRSISGVTENGYYVITPLLPRTSETGSVQLAVLVNRGWVPRSWRDKQLEYSPNDDKASSSKQAVTDKDDGSTWWKFWSKKPEVATVDEPRSAPTKVIGVIRGSEKPSIFVPANDPGNGQWFYVDVPAIARACSLPEDTIYVEDINENVNPRNPYPIPKDVNTLIRHSVMPQDHLNYTMTWYSLSAAVTFMAVRRIRPTNIKR